MVLLLKKKKKNGTYWFEETTYKKNRIRGENVPVVFFINCKIVFYFLIWYFSLKPVCSFLKIDFFKIILAAKKIRVVLINSANKKNELSRENWIKSRRIKLFSKI